MAAKSPPRRGQQGLRGLHGQVVKGARCALSKNGDSFDDAPLDYNYYCYYYDYYCYDYYYNYCYCYYYCYYHDCYYCYYYYYHYHYYCY